MFKKKNPSNYVMVGNQWLDWGKHGLAREGLKEVLRGSFKARDTATQQICAELSRAPGCISKASTQTAWMVIEKDRAMMLWCIHQHLVLFERQPKGRFSLI